MQETVRLPLRSETNVIGRTVYRDLADTWDTWVSKPDSLSDEIRVARAVVPNRCKNVPMRVMNVAGYPVSLPAGALLADLEAVEMIGDYKETAVRRDVERESEGGVEQEHASQLLDDVDPTVPPAVRDALGDLLGRFAATFSTSENDLGRASSVQHRIDTGAQRPFRQALRRQPTVMVEAIDAQVGAMLKADLIEPAQSKWASNVVMVRKFDGSLDFV